MNKRDIIGWDTVNWSICLKVWEDHIPVAQCDCLEIGCGGGGLSLWLALKGHRVVCSDIHPPCDRAKELHKSYGVLDKITYETIDATNIPYKDHFDIVVFKSILGGIWANSGWEMMRRAVQEMHKSLKPHGKLLFIENLRATPIHMFCRKRLIKRNENTWRYPTIEEMRAVLSEFSNVDYKITGFFGTFGRTEWQRIMLGYVDKVVVPMMPKSWQYIMAGTAFPRPRQLPGIEYPQQKRRTA